MNYIEEMMKTAGVEPVYIVKDYREDAKIKCTLPTRKDAEYYQNKFGGELIEGFDFTAEKQLEIIKLLLNGLSEFRGFKGVSNKYYLYFSYINIEHKDFTQALAQLTTELMNAGELDKSKVKEILEDAR